MVVFDLLKVRSGCHGVMDQVGGGGGGEIGGGDLSREEDSLQA